MRKPKLDLENDIGRLRSLYKLIVARSDVFAADLCAERFQKEVTDFSSPLYYPLFVSIVVCYGRPFSENKPFGPLKGKWSEFKNSNFAQMHENLLELRNQVVAHSDMKVRQVQLIPPGCEMWKGGKVSEGLNIRIRTLFMPIEQVPIVQQTIRNLYERLDESVNSELSRIEEEFEIPEEIFGLPLKIET